MSIIVDTDLTFLVNKLGISQLKIQEQYANSSVEEIIKAEAQQGNQAAITLAHELLNNVALVMELFGLADPKNKLMILREMTAAQMQYFLPLMEEKDMLQGMYFFTMDKLMKMLQDIPPEQLVKTMFEMFPPEKVVELMPEKQLNKFLTDTNVDKGKILKNLMSIEPQYLAQMLESITGEAVKGLQKPYDMVKQLGELNPLEFKNSLLNMQPLQKQQLVTMLGKENPEWFQIFDADAYTHIMEVYKDKADVIKAMHVIEQEEMVKMLEQLPNDLLAIVITQMDTKVFAETLMKECPEIMAQIIAR
jgi:Mg/Co/Ni transporter MgtE